MKIGVFVTARLKSRRLKHKILLPLNGKSALDQIISRCKKIIGIDGIVLSTSTNSQDSVLYRNALKNEIEFFPGSEKNVIKRLLDTAQYYNYDAFLAITADNPLFSIYISNILIDRYKSEHHDFMFTTGVPLGMGTQFIDTKALAVCYHHLKNENIEIWYDVLKFEEIFNLYNLHISNSALKDNIRVTMDYPEDYQLFQKIYSFFKPNEIPTIQKVLNIFDKNPEMLRINRGRKQKTNSAAYLKKIKKTFQKNADYLKIYSEQIGHKFNPGITKELFEI